MKERVSMSGFNLLTLGENRRMPVELDGLKLVSFHPPAKPRHKNSLREVGQRFRFRLRANPCVTRGGKRIGLLQLEDQEAWIERKGRLHGFLLPKLTTFDFSNALHDRSDVRISQEQMLRGRQHTGNGIRIFSVLYDGLLTVTEPATFRGALQAGIGHGKVLGLGLLSVAVVT